MNKRLYNIGIMIGAFGIIILLVLIFSGEAYPSILFKMLAPIGLFLTFIGVIKLRKDRPELQRPYKVPLYPIIPAIAIIGGLFVIINQLLTATLIALGGIIITLIGIPVYSITSKK